jgi:uncharacterized membrane protein YtjA (UPF0391 family)
MLPFWAEEVVMLYYVALASFAVALVLGALNFVGITPGAAGAVSLALFVTLALLGAQVLVNYSHHHQRPHAHH